MNSHRFAGKVAIVTGAGRGMGRAVALTLAANGAQVIVNDMNLTRAEEVVGEIVEAGGKAMPAGADVSDLDQVKKMVQATLDRFGAVDILVNNAGILRTTTPMEEIDDAEWDLVMAVNVKGVFNCTKAYCPA